MLLHTKKKMCATLNNTTIHLLRKHFWSIPSNRVTNTSGIYYVSRNFWPKQAPWDQHCPICWYSIGCFGSVPELDAFSVINVQYRSLGSIPSCFHFQRAVEYLVAISDCLQNHLFSMNSTNKLGTLSGWAWRSIALLHCLPIARTIRRQCALIMMSSKARDLSLGKSSSCFAIRLVTRRNLHNICSKVTVPGIGFWSCIHDTWVFKKGNTHSRCHSISMQKL